MSANPNEDRGRNPSVRVVTVSYNTRDLTASCVASVLESVDVDVNVVVVDNASSDGTPAALREMFAAITVIDSGSNLGFAKACNLGAKGAHCDAVMFVNPDATIDPEAIGVLARFASEHPEHGLYGGMVVDSDGDPDISSARPLPSMWNMFCYGTGLSFLAKGSKLFDPESMSGWDRETARSVGMLSGAMLFVPTDVWNELGGFDGRYFMYAEDADLAFRAGEAGYDPVCVPAARAVHDSGAASTSDNKAFMKMRGNATYIRKNWSGVKAHYGMAMLRSGVALRALSRAKGAQSIDWRALWARRSDWSAGY